MPPRKKRSPRKASIRDAVTKPPAAASAKAVSVKPKAKKKPGAWKMPPPLPAGEVFTDNTKKKWVLGGSIGKGGFGEIYLASKQGSSGDSSKENYVIKIEPHENGPLFTEISFYTRAAKKEKIDTWTSAHHLDYLPVPKFIALGSHNHDTIKYRFLVMQKFGDDIEKKFTAAGRKFKIETVCYLAMRLLEAVEFLHESSYIHADIKGSNLLTGHSPGTSHEVYLVDYGLAYRFNPDGQHKEYKEDPRRTHDGTIEFTSIDAHKGVCPSRRADLEILGYCLLQWACGRLPWESNLEDKDYVASEKIRYRSNVKQLMKDCFTSGPAPACLESYMTTVYKLGYEQQPNYEFLKELFSKQLGPRVDGSRTLEWLVQSRKRALPEDQAAGSSSPAKKVHRLPAKPKRLVKAASAVAKRSPIKKKSPIARRRKEKERKEPVESTDSEIIIPKASYPSQLGYSKNEGDSTEPAVSSKREVKVIDLDDDTPPPVKRKRKRKC